jgi:hypothetical protein
MHTDQSNTFFHFLNPNIVDLSSEAISAVQNYSVLFSQQHRVEDKFNVLWFNTFLFTVESQQIAETIRRITSTITSPDQIIALWAVGCHTNLSSYSIERLNEFSQSIQNPVVYFTGALSQPQYIANCKFTLAPLMYFEVESARYWPKLESWERRQASNNIIKTKKFTLMGTKNYPNRKFLLSNIITNNLLDQGYVSYKQVSSGNIRYGFTQQEIDNITQVADSIDQYLPLPEIDKSIEWVNMPREFLLNSYVNLVTDTFYVTEPEVTFISEKVFNAMAHWQMFIMMSPPYTLQYLREQGYQTFSPCIDETYDTIENNYERLLAVTKSAVDFLSQPREVIKETYQKCLPILEHNQQRLFNNRFVETLNKELKRTQDEKIQIV